MVLLGERRGRAPKGIMPPAATEEGEAAAKKWLRREIKIRIGRVGKFIWVQGRGRRSRGDELGECHLRHSK